MNPLNDLDRDAGDVAMDLCDEYYGILGRILTENEIALLMAVEALQGKKRLMDAGRYVH